MTEGNSEDVSVDRLIPREHVTEIRVRYEETDAQGHVHHANYLNYFEIGRIEMLRSSGVNYRELEQSGMMLVVAKANLSYSRGAKFDDLLRLKTIVVKAKGARIHHRYEIYRDDQLICEGDTFVGAVSKEGKIVRLPKWLQMGEVAG